MSMTRSLKTFVLLAALAVLCAAPVSHGQGVSAFFPAPLHWDAFVRLCEPLELSGAQQQAMLPAHEEYLDRAQSLAEDGFSAFIEDTGGTWGMFARNNNDVPYEDLRNRYESLLRRLEGMEDALLEELGSVLDDPQRSMLPSVRDRRLRSRLLDASWPSFSFGNFEEQAVAFEIADIEIPGGDAPRIYSDTRNLLLSHDAQRTSILKRLHATRLDAAGLMQEMRADSLSVMQDIGDDFERAGENPTPDAVPEAPADVAVPDDDSQRSRRRASRNAQRRFEEGQQRMREAEEELYTEVRADKRRLLKLNQSTMNSIAALLEPADAWQYRQAIYRQALPLLARDRVQRLIDHERGERENDLPALTALESIESSYHEEASSLNSRIVTALIDEEADKLGMSSPFTVGFDPDDDDDAPSALASLKEQRQDLQDMYMDRIDPSGELQARAREKRGKTSRTLSFRDMAMGRAGGDELDDFDMENASVLILSDKMVIASDEAEFTMMLDEMGPIGEFIGDITGTGSVGRVPAIDVDRAERLAGDLEFDEGTHSLFRALHMEYASNYARINRAAEPVRIDSDFEGKQVIELMENSTRERRQRLQHGQMADSTFFENIEAAILGSEPAPPLDALKRSRQRAFIRGELGAGGFGGMISMFSGSGGGNDWKIDIVDLCDDHGITQKTSEELDATLLQWENDVLPALATLRDLAREPQVAMRMMEFGDDAEGGDEPEFDMNIFGEMMTQARKRSDAERAISQLNQDCLDTMGLLLDDDAAMTLDMAYGMQAFPQVSRDRHSARNAIDASMAMENITLHQRGELGQLLTEFTQHVHDLNYQMIHLLRTLPVVNLSQMAFGGGGDGRSAMEERQRITQQVSRIRFQRNDYHQKTREVLRGILTEEQQLRIAEHLERQPDDPMGPFGNMMMFGQ